MSQQWIFWGLVAMVVYLHIATVIMGYLDCCWNAMAVLFGSMLWPITVFVTAVVIAAKWIGRMFVAYANLLHGLGEKFYNRTHQQ